MLANREIMHTFRIKHTPEVARRAYWSLSKRRAGGFHVGAVIVAVVCMIGTIKGSTPWLYGFGLGACSMYAYNLWAEIHNVGLKAGNRAFNITLDNDGFTQESEGKSMFVPWNGVGELRKMKEIWLLLAKDNSNYSSFPLKDIRAEERAFLEAKVLAVGGSVTQ